MSSLVRALDAYQQEASTKPSSNPASSLKKGLSVEEIFGNIFVINFAGHDTTANTLAFSMLLLASEPSVQQWVAEEIQQVTRGLTPEEWTYERLFEKLQRCRAILVGFFHLFFVARPLTLLDSTRRSDCILPLWLCRKAPTNSFRLSKFRARAF